MRAPLVLTSSWEVDDFSEIEYDGQAGYLSKGVSGSVFRAQWQGQNCALKIFNYAGGDQEVEGAFQNELDILRKLNHGNLVRFFAACTKPPPDGQLGILMELMDGSLASLLYGKASTGPSGKRHEMCVHPSGPLPRSHRPRLNPRLCRSDKRLVAIAYGISNGMRFLHKNHICHRDLKSHNVLYDKQLNIKLCDFAFSKFKATLEKKSVRFESRVGTPQWMAPEVLRGEEYTFSADVYSFGVILWEMISRQQPFADFHAMAVMFKVGTEGLRLTPPDDCPPFWQRLMEACWLPPRERPTFEKVFQLVRQVKQQLDRNPKVGFKDGLGADLLAGGR
jgi:serine/threonine protein kinase